MLKEHWVAPAFAHSAISGLVWPAVLASDAAALASLMFQLDQSQWQSAQELAVRQHSQLVQTAAHAQAHSPQFRQRLRAAGLQPQDLATRTGLRRLPLMRRREVQEAGASLYCAQIPRAHEPVMVARTSGSSGEPVVVKRTAVSRLFWLALTLREHLWQRREFTGTLAAIRADLHGEQQDWPNWGLPASLLFETGASHALAINIDIARQFDWLQRLNPDYLLVYPTALAGLLDLFEQNGTRLSRLRQIRTIGETLSPDTRARALRVLGSSIADTYSSEEVGVIATQCPESGLYHVAAESLIVEILNEEGEACAPGEIGRVVVTDLHNFATPLIRYDLGDFAESASACSCGRGLPALRRVAGRQRNMVRLPDGRRFWPLVGYRRYAEVAPIRQYQLIQRAADTIELRLVTAESLSAHQEARLGELVREALGFPFKLNFIYFDHRIPLGASGKFEEFICLVE